MYPLNVFFSLKLFLLASNQERQGEEIEHARTSEIEWAKVIAWEQQREQGRACEDEKYVSDLVNI